MKKYIKPLLIFISLAFFLFISIRLYYKLTDDFHFNNISETIVEDPQWAVPLSEEELQKLKQILDQNFTYIGKGAQSYVFGSADGNYVIKFFKFKHLRPSFFVSHLPEIGPLKEYKAKNLSRKKRKLMSVFHGHSLAYTLDKEYSGLVFVHLNKSLPLNLKAHLTDKLGLFHEIPLNDVYFVVQKKGITLAEALKKPLSEGDVQTAVDKAVKVLKMYIEEYQKGIIDQDHGVSHNIGFIGESPFHLDIGKIEYNESIKDPKLYGNDLKHVAKMVKKWVKENFPQEELTFSKALDEGVERLLSNPSLSTDMPPLQNPS